MSNKLISKLTDKHFSGFECQRCGRNLKHAFSIDGKGVYGSECVLEIAGMAAYKKAQKQISLQKIWDKIVENPKVYSLNAYVSEYGSLEAVKERFFDKGSLC